MFINGCKIVNIKFDKMNIGEVKLFDDEIELNNNYDKILVEELK